MKGHVGDGSGFDGFKASDTRLKLSRSIMSYYISTVNVIVQERLLEITAFDMDYSSVPLVAHQT